MRGKSCAIVQKTGHFLKDEGVKSYFAWPGGITFLMAYLISFFLLFCTCACEMTGLASTVESSKSYQEALEKYRSKDYPAALAAARRALDEDSDNAAYHHIYGLTLAALQQFREAEENLQRAIALKPAEANFHYDYGYVLYQQKKYDQAVPVLQRAVDLDGENLMACFLL